MSFQIKYDDADECLWVCMGFCLFQIKIDWLINNEQSILENAEILVGLNICLVRGIQVYLDRSATT